MTEQPRVPGVRTIDHDPAQPLDARWQGHVEPAYANEGWRKKVWKGSAPEQVVEQMNHDLGPLPDSEYIVNE